MLKAILRVAQTVVVLQRRDSSEVLHENTDRFGVDSEILQGYEGRCGSGLNRLEVLAG